jgi:geranylgeranyl pyrophosphate synthase
LVEAYAIIREILHLRTETSMEKSEKTNAETSLDRADKIIRQRGEKGWLLAQEMVLSQETNSQRLHEAIEYVMLVYKPDYFRPAVVSLCCEAAGGSVETTVPIGAFLILLGRAIGIHDDIIDKLTLRNRRQTVLGKFGQDTALIVSDILSFKGFTLLRKAFESGIPQKKVIRVLETIDQVWFQQGEAEILELQSRGQTDVAPDQCLAKIKMRASELEAIARIGAILGHGSQNTINALGGWGRSLGTMSILRDEIIDMAELNVLEHRIRNESLPLPLIYAIQNPKSKSRIISLIHKSRLTTRELTEISRLSQETGGTDYVASLISKIYEDAELALRKSKIRNDGLVILSASLMIDPQNLNSTGSLSSPVP